MRGETEPAVQRPGGLVAVLNLEVEVPGAVRDGPGGESGGDDGGEPAAPVLRGDLDGGEPGPACRHGHPADGDGAAGSPDRGERLPGRGREDVPGDRREARLAAVVVQA